MISGIGSLPHHNVDAAIEYSLRHSLPFLPQIPIRNAWEYALPQTLEGLPGLNVESEGAVSLSTAVWNGRSSALEERLAKAFARSFEEDAFVPFELSGSTACCWQPFLWELEEREIPSAKIQLMGPLTAQWVMQFEQVADPAIRDRVGSQIFRLFLARALGMTRRLQRAGVEPVLFIDEPALYVLDPRNPRHLLGLEELKVAVRTLQKDKVRVGIHCCSDTHWEAILGLGLDWVSIDVGLSLNSFLGATPALRKFLRGGGAVAFGVVPTSPNTRFENLRAGELVAELREKVNAQLSSAEANELWCQTILTPACGLALHTPAHAETVLSLLQAAETELSGTRAPLL